MGKQENSPWIVLMTHGNLGTALVGSAEMMMGKLKNIKTISLLPGESPEDLLAVVQKELKEVPKNSLILTDLFGGTPSNVSAGFAVRGYYVLAGVNLPILLEAEMYRTTDSWDNVLSYLIQIGASSVINVNEKVCK